MSTAAKNQKLKIRLRKSDSTGSVVCELNWLGPAEIEQLEDAFESQNVIAQALDHKPIKMARITLPMALGISVEEFDSRWLPDEVEEYTLASEQLVLRGLGYTLEQIGKAAAYRREQMKLGTRVTVELWDSVIGLNDRVDEARAEAQAQTAADEQSG